MGAFLVGRPANLLAYFVRIETDCTKYWNISFLDHFDCTCCLCLFFHSFLLYIFFLAFLFFPMKQRSQLPPFSYSCGDCCSCCCRCCCCFFADLFPLKAAER